MDHCENIPDGPDEPKSGPNLISDHECCCNCHFLVRREHVPGSLGEAETVSQDHRRRIADNENPTDVLGRDGDCSLWCYCKVWADDSSFVDQERHLKKVVQMDRHEACFFYPYTPGLLLNPARRLENRAAARREAEKDRRHTRTTIAIALWALIFSITISLASLAWNIWIYFRATGNSP
jgi:hypothetical protein